MEYISGHHQNDECIFCAALEQEDGPGNLVVARWERAFLMLNRYPYTNGHVMVAPIEHRPTLEDLEPETLVQTGEMIARTLKVLRALYHPEGFNVGANIGAAAGAGVPGHVHFHIVPRWVGDTNFMTSIGGTRVLPEDLEDTQARVKAAWESL